MAHECTELGIKESHSALIPFYYNTAEEQLPQTYRAGYSSLTVVFLPDDTSVEQ